MFHIKCRIAILFAIICKIYYNFISYISIVSDFNSLLNRVKNIEDLLKEIGTSETVKQSHITLTQEEYEYRLENDMIHDDQFYYIIEND